MSRRAQWGWRVACVWLAGVAGAAGSCGRTPERVLGTPEVCEDVAQSNPRRDGEPSPSAVGRCDDLARGAPLFGCSDAESCEAPVLRCDPSRGLDTDTHRCCSDDPSTLDGGVPRFSGREGAGAAPLFAGDSNARSTSGVCVNVELVDDSLREPAADGCPVPCNPTWDERDTASVCGPGNVCCQTVQMEAEDCVLDELDGRWRAVAGTDIAGRFPPGALITNWSPTPHATHQDPGGRQCAEIAGVSSNDSTDPEYLACVRRLTVANQRGFCMKADECCVSPSYVDACERLNE